MLHLMQLLAPRSAARSRWHQRAATRWHPGCLRWVAQPPLPPAVHTAAVLGRHCVRCSAARRQEERIYTRIRGASCGRQRLLGRRD